MDKTALAVKTLIRTYGLEAYDDETQWAYLQLYPEMRERKKQVRETYRQMQSKTPLFSAVRRELKSAKREALASLQRVYDKKQLQKTFDLLIHRFPHKHIDVNKLEELLE